MSILLLIDESFGESRAALLVDDRLEALAREWTDQPSLVDALYWGRVTRTVKSQGLAFVDCGLGQAVAVRAVDCLDRTLPDEGAKALAQITRDPIAEKGPRATLRPGLAGRLVVYRPHGRGCRVSRRGGRQAAEAKIDHAAIAAAIDPDREGVILRAAAVTAPSPEVIAEIETLRARWRDLSAGVHRVRIPSEAWPPPHPGLRLLADRGGKVDRVIGDCAETARRFRAVLAAEAYPITVESHRGDPPLFDAFAGEAAIAALAAPKVALEGGGAVTIQPTRALTAIDVDSGPRDGLGGTGSTARRVNIAAAREIARQMRLREIGGLIVIDFIDMANPADQAAVLHALKAGFSDDPAPVRIAPFSAFGLVEMTRQRRRAAPGYESDCERCDGTGVIASPRAAMVAALRALRRAGAGAPGRTVRLVAAPEFITGLKADFSDDLARLGRSLGAAVECIANPEAKPFMIEVG